MHLSICLGCGSRSKRMDNYCLDADFRDFGVVVGIRYNFDKNTWVVIGYQIRVPILGYNTRVR